MTDSGFSVPNGSDEPEIEPDITVMEVRGEKEIGFMGMKHLELPEAKKDKIHDVYADIIIELDDVKDEYVGADRAWHIGRVLSEYDVDGNSEMTLTDLGAFNTIDDMHTRRLFYAKHVYGFWPDQQYDPRHSITALGELASRAMNRGVEETTRAGYERVLEHDEQLTKTDVLIWDALESTSLEDIVSGVVAEYETPAAISDAVKRLILLTNQPLPSVSKSEVEALITKELSN